MFEPKNKPAASTITENVRVETTAKRLSCRSGVSAERRTLREKELSGFLPKAATPVLQRFRIVFILIFIPCETSLPIKEGALTYALNPALVCLARGAFGTPHPGRASSAVLAVKLPVSIQTAGRSRRLFCKFLLHS